MWIASVPHHCFSLPAYDDSLEHSKNYSELTWALLNILSKTLLPSLKKQQRDTVITKYMLLLFDDKEM